MRILKYIFLLLLLISVGVAVFVATQRGDYEITQTMIINSPRPFVFNYVNDYRNWETWIVTEDKDAKFTYPAVTAGKGASFSWKGDENEGSMRTISAKENDSIVQKTISDGLPGEMRWIFKDTLGKTKVTLRAKGRMAFMPKIYAALKGGPEKVMAVIFDKNLSALNKTLDYEINTYKIKIDGVTDKTGSYYLHQSITSTIDNMPRNMRIMMSKLVYFFKKNNIPMNGKPFVLYDYYDKSKGLSKFSVCIPIRDEIYTSPGSDIMFGKFDSFRAVKTTLNGDYSHLSEAWDKTFDYIRTNNLTLADADYLELYRTGKEDSKSPSKWITEIYVPVKDQAAAVIPVTTAPLTVLPTNIPVEAKPKPKPKPQEATDERSIP